jgi:hypothetical protein
MRIQLSLQDFSHWLYWFIITAIPEYHKLGNFMEKINLLLEAKKPKFEGLHLVKAFVLHCNMAEGKTVYMPEGQERAVLDFTTIHSHQECFHSHRISVDPFMR